MTVPIRCSPCTGGGPPSSASASLAAACSPRTRGWSRERAPHRPWQALLPAPAGMVPTSRASISSRTAALRVRGDSPGDPSQPA
ncbi:hypothetical protein C3489_36510 [Streptomyces sp. Ru71]|nr:hypothetical protein C3489_36510 [Streptomyces sp. Ru71]